MVNAGRILIIAQGEWSNLTNYEQLDLVTRGDIAYLARKASVGVDPATDTQMTYWQPFGSAAKIATTELPGLVMPDGTTITIDSTGLIQANLGVADLADVVITNIADGSIIRYDSATQKWKNVVLGSAAYKASTNAVTSGSTDLVESGAVHTALESKVNTSDIGTAAAADTTSSATSGSEDVITSGGVYDLHKVSRFTVNTSSWTSDSSSQSGKTLYKKTISLSHVYVESPSVDISTSSGTGLPTTAQQTAYDLLQYVTIDGTTLTLYASNIPSTTFYIQIEGVD